MHLTFQPVGVEGTKSRIPIVTHYCHFSFFQIFFLLIHNHKHSIKNYYTKFERKVIKS